MTPENEKKVEAAVSAHAQWLLRLKTAIEKGASEFKPEAIRVDNACEFGKWLYGEFPAGLRAQPVFEEIRSLHARFHQEASAILAHAIGQRRDEALRRMASGGPFMQLSGSLVLTLRSLKTL